ncbi:MAG: hypothetical protein INF79_04960 [Roseomonas sp.]|nr:hypothetical protein [Roseomonas sp.]
MSVILGGWGFAMFLWTKVLFEAFFYDGITVLGALLIAIVFAIFVFCFSGLSAQKFFPVNAFPGQVKVDLSLLIRKSIVSFFSCSLVFLVVSRLIILGFSEDLNRRLTVFAWNGSLSEKFVYFLVILFVPCFLFYLFVLFGTAQNSKRDH